MLYTANTYQLITAVLNYRRGCEVSLTHLKSLCSFLYDTHVAPKGGGEAAGLKHHPQTPHPEKQNLKYTDFVDTMMSKVICDLRSA
jgi:hypothetical protein